MEDVFTLLAIIFMLVVFINKDSFVLNMIHRYSRDFIVYNEKVSIMVRRWVKIIDILASILFFLCVWKTITYNQYYSELF